MLAPGSSDGLCGPYEGSREGAPGAWSGFLNLVEKDKKKILRSFSACDSPGEQKTSLELVQNYFEVLGKLLCVNLF